jgi:hypothetical protein
VLQTSTPPAGPARSRNGTARRGDLTAVHRAADNPPTMPKPDRQETRPMCTRPSLRQAGFTFAELAFALLILVIGGVVLINHLAVNYTTTQSERDRVFAFSKAQAILSEIQNVVDRNDVDAVALDTLDDGFVNRPTLSIQGTAGVLIAPDHVVSGNMQRNGQWLWSRRITVQPFAGVDNRNVRYVTVRVFRKDDQGNDRPLADLSAVVNSAGDAYPSTQVYDLYLFAVENVPGWWVFMDSMKPFMESMIMDLQTRNPGLQFRTHWITKASFGRNQGYRPYTNEVLDSIQPVSEVYHYPGRMPDGSASAFYYVPDNMRARINVEGVERHGYDAALNPYPYALADFFNNAMRYDDEKALWEARVRVIEAREQAIRAAQLAGTTPPSELDDMSKEPTLRLFLEDLNTDPAKYRNAMIVNLHGELLPMPALRNYSDPAKSQVAYPNLRVVTHPEELRTKNNDAGVTSPLRFRMYAFGYETATVPYPAGSLMADPMVVEFVGINLTDALNPTKLKADCVLQNVRGGVTVGGTTNYSGWLPAKHSTDALIANEMFYRAQWVPPSGGVDGFTRVYLYNTPIGATPVTQAGLQFGLAGTERARLYRMQYVPCPIGAGPVFTPDLTSSGVGPKNTARWTLQINETVLTNNSFVSTSNNPYNPTGDVKLQVRTRIASGLGGGATQWENSGQTFPTPVDPDNLSVTYAYWTNSREDVPITERSQFNGDPRHCPYKDCFNLGDDFPNSYNWYHDNLVFGGETATTDFPCMVAGQLADHWGAGQMACDVPRYFQLLREGLLKSRCIYSSITGWSYYYLGIGDDVGSDTANGYPNSIPTELTPYGAPGSTGYLNTIIGQRRYVRSGSGGEYWWGMPWLGELYPDDVLTSQWLDVSSGTPRGNLTAGTGAATLFYSAECNAVYGAGGGAHRSAYGTQVLDSMQRTSSYGCTTLFNIGTAASTFQHSSATTNGSLTGVGNEMSTNYNTWLPPLAPVSRPFRLNAATTVGEHWNFAPYSTRNTATLYRQYYSHAGGSGSAMIKLVDAANTNAAYINVNGISNAVDNGTSFIAQYTLLTLVHSMLEAGSTTNTLRIQELPRIEITSPTDIAELDNPSVIPIQFGVSWTRWDGLAYTATGTFGETESELEYVVMYSRDGGRSWMYLDETPALPGVRPTDPAYLVADAGAGTETVAWDVSSGYPEGSYMLRVDCYRQGAMCHYAFHQTHLFIQR